MQCFCTTGIIIETLPDQNLWIELILFNSYFIPQPGYTTIYSSTLLLTYAQVVSRFTLTSKTGIRNLDHASLCTCAFINTGQLDFV